MAYVKAAIFGMGFFVATSICFADESAKLVGTWKLVAFEAEMQATGTKEPVMGQNPTGYVVVTSEGRFFALFTGEGRKSSKTVQDRADLLNSMIGYTGIYRVEGDRWITKVDVAWNPDFVGTEQMRFFKFDGNRLYVSTPFGIQPNWPEKGMIRRIITLEREGAR